MNDNQIQPLPVPCVPCAMSTSRTIRNARREEAKLRRKISSAYERGETNALKRHIGRYLSSESAKIVAIEQAGARRKKKKKHYLNNDQIITHARALNVYLEPEEHVSVTPHHKSDGFRAIHSFGQLYHARQLMVASVLEASARLNPRQYGKGNGGRSAACRKVLDAMTTHRFAVEVDIKDFYPSIDRNWLCEGLPINQEVVERVILAQDADKVPQAPYQSIHCTGPTSLLEYAQRGLPQGAASSSIVAEIVIGTILAELPDGPALIINYADNFLIMAPTRRGVEAALSSLRSAISRSPAGHFMLHEAPVRRVVDGFDFLGYSFRSRNGRNSAVPQRRKLVELDVRLGGFLGAIYREEKSEDYLRGMIYSWRKAFSLWRGDYVILRMILRYTEAVPEVKQRVAVTVEWLKGLETARFEEDTLRPQSDRGRLAYGYDGLK